MLMSLRAMATAKKSRRNCPLRSALGLKWVAPELRGPRFGLPCREEIKGRKTLVGTGTRA